VHVAPRITLLRERDEDRSRERGRERFLVESELEGANGLRLTKRGEKKESAGGECRTSVEGLQERTIRMTD